jgi:hypothetical protein
MCGIVGRKPKVAPDESSITLLGPGVIDATKQKVARVSKEVVPSTGELFRPPLQVEGTAAARSYAPSLDVVGAAEIRPRVVLPERHDRAADFAGAAE